MTTPLVLATSMGFKMVMEETRARSIFRALRKLGFDGDDLDKNLLYFYSLPPFSAEFVLAQMLQAKGLRKRAS